MKPGTVKRGDWKQALKRVGENLYRSDATEIYYAIFKRNGKQIRRSLHTTDKEWARRKTETLRQQVGRISTQEGRHLPFAEYDRQGVLIGGAARQWLDTVGVEPSTRDRYLNDIRNLAGSFTALTVRNITLTRIEAWINKRNAGTCAASTFNQELDVLKRILEYCVEHGSRLDNPAYRIKRRKGDKKAILIPSRDEYHRVMQRMRDNDAGASADLCEILARSGCRKSEIVGNPKYHKEPLRWRDIDFARGVFTISQSKNHEARTVPLFPMLADFLKELAARPGCHSGRDDRIIPIHSARTALETACRQLGLPQFCHHTMRHFFCSNAIEAGVDFKVIAGWLGHKDGGILVSKTYGHMRNEHSATMAKRMTLGVSEPPPANVIPFPVAASR